MRILAFSDIHNDWHTLRSLVEESADFYICAGDLTYGEKGIETAAKILEPIKNRLFIVPGNNERPETIEKLFPKAVHGRVIEIHGVKIGGLGGSPRTPFNTLFEWEEEEAYRILENIGYTDIFVSHAPPRGTILAKARDGTDIGSEAIRWYIESFQPRYAVVGHVHERMGETEKIGETIVFNPGWKGKLFEIQPLFKV